MKLTVYNHQSLFDELQPEWNDLLQRSITNRVFSTWEWQSTWWEAYQDRGDLWVITARSEGGELLGIAPWFIDRHPTLGRIVRSIGCVDVTDYLDVIVDKDCIDPVLDSFAGYLAQHRDLYDAVDLCNISEDSPTYARFPTILSRQGFQVEVKQQEVCPIIKLPGDWESYLQTLDKKQRHELRRKIRRTENAPENVDWYIVSAEHNLQEEVERFLTLMAASQQGKSEFLKDPRNVAFFKAIAPVMYDKGWLQLSFLTVGGTAVAAYLNFDYHDVIMVYNSGLLPEGFAQLSPGIVLLAHNIRHAIESGRKVFDFLRGNEEYKYRMGAQDVVVYMLRAS